MWETPDSPRTLIEEFLTGVRRVTDPTRVLATVLFTDIVGSTGRARRLGDRRWRELLNLHDELARRLVEEFPGQLVKTTGDGIFATFDGPGRGSAAPPPSETSWLASGSRSGWGCTPGRLSCVTAISPALLLASRPG